MLQAIAQWIDHHRLFASSDRLLLAVSGGMDSVVMFDVLHRLGYTRHAGIAHCNFQLRGAASDGDAAFVAQLAADYGLAYHGRAFDTQAEAQARGISIQMAARDLRYAFFEEVCHASGYTHLLTAHHLDDRLETFWLNFARGAGLRGITSLQAQNGRICRPLLGTPHAAIADYQQQQQLSFREDSSNASDAYRRNHFRHHVLPALYAWTPNLGEKAATNFEHLEQMLMLYHEGVERYRQQWIHPQGAGFCIDRQAVATHPAAATLLWEWLHPLGFSAEQCRQAREAQVGSLLYSLSHVLLVKQHELEVAPLPTDAPTPYTWPADAPQLDMGKHGTLTQVAVPHPDAFTDAPNTVQVSAEQLRYPLQVRRWQAGDAFCPLGMGGKRQKLQDFFTNQKIDRLARQRQWLLVNGDGEIIWVVGLRLDDRFKIDTPAATVIRFTFFPH